MKKLKLGIYLDYKNKNIDLSTPQNGNPGIGGTEFLIVSLAYYLQLFFSEQCEIIIFSQDNNKLPENLMVIIAENSRELVEQAVSNSIDILIFRSADENYLITESLKNTKIKAIAWLHNHYTPQKMLPLTKSDEVKRLVCAGHEQLDMLRDNNIFYKSTYIYNAVNVPEQNIIVNEKKENIVAYTGALTDQKGFHILAAMWPKILRKIPDAQLWVFGSGDLYVPKNISRLTYTDPDYEKVFLPYLLDSDGKLHQSVKFFGKTGIEKFEYYNQVKVGVVNPGAKTETFCLSGVEFQASGVPVVSLAKHGLLDTVQHKKTGLLGKNKKQVCKNIIRLLEDKELNKFCGLNGRQFVRQNFNWRKITQEWYHVIMDTYNDVPVVPLKMSSHIFTNLKILREINRLIKKYLHLKKLPCVRTYVLLIKKIIGR